MSSRPSNIARMLAINRPPSREHHENLRSLECSCLRLRLRLGRIRKHLHVREAFDHPFRLSGFYVYLRSFDFNFSCYDGWLACWIGRIVLQTLSMHKAIWSIRPFGTRRQHIMPPSDINNFYSSKTKYPTSSKSSISYPKDSLHIRTHQHFINPFSTMSDPSVATQLRDFRSNIPNDLLKEWEAPSSWRSSM